ncbi:MAG TPA: hypothetical protein VL049_06985 [Candidatus Dormibacteraeota bacterium]|nr:hypothetical protein [Candidatus Dormibacteraeota bacterium]
MANLNAIPAYGDTAQYFQLAESLHVDQYRTLFYPLLLRGLQAVASLLNARVELLVYIVQTAAALLSIACLGTALWEVTAASGRFAPLAAVPPASRRLVIGAAALVVFAEPLVNHFALSVMTDSLAASLTTVGVAALVRIAVLGDARLRTAIVAWLAIAGAGFMRAEKVEVFAVVIAVTLAILAFRPQAGGEDSTPSRQRRRVLATLATLLLTPAVVVLGLNRATQTADYGWPPLTVATRLFVRSAWPRLTDIRPLLSAEAQAVVSAADAERFDRHYNEYLSLVLRLRAAAGGSDRLVDEISGVALRSRGGEIALATGIDALRYAAPMVAYPADLVVGAQSASNWTDSRMRMAHPSLTRAYLLIATAVLIAIQLPLLAFAVVRRGGRDRRVQFAAWLTVGTALVNAALYAIGNGLQNVRYALPGYVLLYAVIVWANLAVLATAWRASATARAAMPATRRQPRGGSDVLPLVRRPGERADPS